MYVYTWLASIAIATLAAGIIAIALPNSAADELNRASAAQAIFANYVAATPHQRALPQPAQR